MITKINRIKEHRIFQDFAWPSTLPDFPAKVLIYGWNGSGKTTLSNLFRHLEKKKNVTEGEITFTIDRKSISGDTIASSVLPNVRVFNRSFIDENIFKPDGHVSPIYVLGEENVEKQQRLEDLKAQLVNLQGVLAQQSTVKTAETTEANRIATTTANDVIKPALRSSGNNPYNNYNKSHFERRYEAFVSSGVNIATSVLNDTDLDSQKHRLNTNEKPSIRPVQYSPPDLQSLNDCILVLTKQTVTSAVIDRLQSSPSLSSWVEEGLRLTREVSAESCLFCEQPLPTNSIERLNAHFNDAYQDFINSIDNQTQQIDTALGNAGKAIESLPHEAEFYDQYQPAYREAVAKTKDEFLALETWLTSCKKILGKKRTTPFEALQFDATTPNFGQGLVTLNDIISQHNSETSAFAESVRQAREAIEAHHVALRLSDYRATKRRLADAEAGIATTQTAIQSAQQEIMLLEKDITDHRRPAEELNLILQRYLGHCDLQLETLETGYWIKRGDQPADNLSEGERTTISFLYFLQTLEDKNFQISDGIVVIDDPVSSLDSNCLFQTFAFMKERLKNVQQLIILTHSHAFFRQVNNWFHHIDKYKKKGKPPDTYLYMTMSHSKNGSRYSTISQMEGLLKKYESEYQYLFKYVHDVARIQVLDYDSLPHAPNAARRLLEAFLAFKKPAQAGDLYAQLQELDYDEVAKTRIIRLCHTGSHSGFVQGTSEEFLLSAEIPIVLNDILALVETLDPEHFNEMIVLVSPPLSEAELVT